MTKILVAWLGHTDIRASRGVAEAGQGPIARALEDREYRQLTLLSSLPRADAEAYVEWLASRHSCAADLLACPLEDPTDYGAIHTAAVQACNQILEANPEARLTFHLSPGTPAMAAVWILLARARYAAALIQSSPEAGVQTVVIPFEISAEFLPDLLRPQEQAAAAAAPCPMTYSRPPCSVTPGAPSPAPRPSVVVTSRPPTRARCFSMRSASCRRVHRSLSWLARVEELEAIGAEAQPQPDPKYGPDPTTAWYDDALVMRWIGFNSLYGVWNEEYKEPARDLQSCTEFIKRVVDLDADEVIGDTLTEHRDLVMAILDDGFLDKYFWKSPGEDKLRKARKAVRTGQRLYAEGRLFVLTDFVIRRIYNLRCQLVHGADLDWGPRVARAVERRSRTGTDPVRQFESVDRRRRACAARGLVGRTDHGLLSLSVWRR